MTREDLLNQALDDLQMFYPKNKYPTLTDFQVSGLMSEWIQNWQTELEESFDTLYNVLADAIEIFLND